MAVASRRRSASGPRCRRCRRSTSGVLDRRSWRCRRSERRCGRRRRRERLGDASETCPSRGRGDAGSSQRPRRDRDSCRQARSDPGRPSESRAEQLAQSAAVSAGVEHVLRVMEPLEECCRCQPVQWSRAKTLIELIWRKRRRRRRDPQILTSERSTSTVALGTNAESGQSLLARVPRGQAARVVRACRVP